MANNSSNIVFSCLSLSVFLGIFSACSVERNPCLEPKVPKLTVACYQYKLDTKTYIDTALPNANFVSLDIDSARFWYWGAKGISKFDLVLSPLRDTVRWVLQVDSARSPIDTISFIYKRQLKFISNACGYSYDFELKNIIATNQNLDSVRISNNLVSTKAGTENVKIYF